MNLSTAKFEEYPFPHFFINGVLNDDIADQLLDWMEVTNHWYLTETDFYTQYEFSLLNVSLPPALAMLKQEETIKRLKDTYASLYPVSHLELVGVTAHKLISGYKMGVHNDFIGPDETHRLVIQVNSGWDETKGGYLMLFHSSKADDVAQVIRPVHNSAVGFEISPTSYHAVSTVYDFTRYTLVYTFRSLG